MSIKQTKDNLKELLEEDSNKVIALTGKWGTGKTFLWSELQKEIDEGSAKSPLYVSLFGIKNVEELKLRLLQNALPFSDEKSAGRKKTETALSRGASMASKIPMIQPMLQPFLSLLDDAAQLSAPWFLEKRFIVIDDIERKNDKLDIDEVMGFINEYTSIYKARFLLILNSDQLMDRKVWDKLREKVIDHEVALETTAEEAFEIACLSQTSDYAEIIKSSVKTCGITNIRIIQKIIRATNRLLAGRTDISEEIQKRVVPSIVLLGAIYYKGLEGGPDFNFIFSNLSNSRFFAIKNNQPKLSDEDEKQRRKWKSLMTSMRIYHIDEFEENVVNFLESGLLNQDRTKIILDRYVHEKDALKAQQLCNDFFDIQLWSIHASDAELLEKARTLLPHVTHFDVVSLTRLHNSVKKLAHGTELADQMIDTWVKKFREKDHTNTWPLNVFGHDIHPAIRAEFDRIQSNRPKVMLSLLEACHNVAENNGVKQETIDTMLAATEDQYEADLRRLNGIELKLLMLQSAKMYVNQIGHAIFGHALWHFIAACRKICYVDKDSRLSETIRVVFQEHRIACLLEVFDGPSLSQQTSDANQG